MCSVSGVQNHLPISCGALLKTELPNTHLDQHFAVWKRSVNCKKPQQAVRVRNPLAELVLVQGQKIWITSVREADKTDQGSFLPSSQQHVHVTPSSSWSTRICTYFSIHVNFWTNPPTLILSFKPKNWFMTRLHMQCKVFFKTYCGNHFILM